MFTSSSLDALVVAHQRGRELQAQAAAERLGGRSGLRGALAAYLRHAADRLDPAPVTRRPVRQS
jgi:hypothetical protein